MQVDLIGLGAQYNGLRDQINEAVIKSLEQISVGAAPQVRAFETEFAAYCRVRFAIGVGSGTDAIYLALRGCGVRAGDEVITVANGQIAAVQAIALLGAVPVFIDVHPQTYTMDPSRIEPAITSLTRAVVPVHLYGQMADMSGIMAVARRHGLAVIEDACHATGAMDQGKRPGSLSDAAAFSFSMARNLGAYGEAGAVTTNSYAIAECIRVLRDHGPTGEYEHESIRRYEDQGIGINARLDELQAAVLRVKLRHLDQWNDLRANNARTYGLLLENQDCVRPAVRSGANHVYQFYVVQVPDRDYLRQSLANRGIDTGVHYQVPVHRRLGCSTIGRVSESLPVTEALARRVLSLPMHPELKPEHIEYVAACVKEQLGALTADRSRRLGGYTIRAYPRGTNRGRMQEKQQSSQPVIQP